MRISHNLAKALSRVEQASPLARHLFGANRPQGWGVVPIDPSHPLRVLRYRYQDLHRESKGLRAGWVHQGRGSVEPTLRRVSRMHGRWDRDVKRVLRSSL